MTESVRRRVFLVAAVGLVALLAWGMSGLPDFGDYQGPYGDILNKAAVPARHATNVVNLVNFDYRAFDTMGEEFIFFAAVIGVTVLLRERREEQARPAGEEEGGARVEQTSDALKLTGLVLLPATMLLGVYIITHGNLSPGGGFQGGVVLVTGGLVVYLVGESLRAQRSPPLQLAEFLEGFSAGAYVLVGLAGLITGAVFLENVLPLGPQGGLLSGGIVPLINLAVGFEIAAGIVLMISEFIEETYMLRHRDSR